MCLMKKWLQFRWWKLLILIIVLLGLGMSIYLNPYTPDARALEAMKGGNGITVSEENQWIQFDPEKPRGANVILYPGALVEPESYAPMAKELATQGHRTYIVKMPLNLAVLGGDRADAILTKEPNETFVIGGHSLGGVMASRYAANHSDRFAGVFFLASYPDSKGSLLATDLSVLSLTGSDDGVLKKDTYESSKSYLPQDAEYFAIEGGNHAQFGSYGAQKGDNPARITPEVQLQKMVEKLTEWINRLK
ncbi:alpha/beta hydrolase [Paenibacillus antarcticus]|uniref:Alpha/beta hydrolase n=2 Tax=Paenibacillus antarcticus TaxID=253703 RepID=A0A168MQZ3_9BACL|nr:alpha/beta hydrolase [Paenibacillus antarcticus]